MSLPSWLWFAMLAMLSVTTVSATSIAKPGCLNKCGGVTIPYPFGIGLDGACSLSRPYNINCNTSYDPPKPFIGSTNLEIMDISDSGEMRIVNFMATRCYQGGQVVESSQSTIGAHISVDTLPLVFSHTANKFTVIGCDDLALIGDTDGHTSGCITTCTTLDSVVKYNGSCSGIGCCQTAIPKGVKVFLTLLESLHNHTNVSDFNTCGAAFLAEENKFTFNVADFYNHSAFIDRTVGSVPVVLDWFVGVNETCHQAQQAMSRSAYACQENTNCTDFGAGSQFGYRCSCLPGYQGNSYLSPGCTDIDECAGPNNLCSHVCINTPGGYKCACPKGHRGNGLKNGTPCSSDRSEFVTGLIVAGLSVLLGSALSLLFGWWLYAVIKRRKAIQQRAKNFEKNGGLLLQHQVSSDEEFFQRTKIFTIYELEKATDHFNQSRILGQGGQGTVYKGMLSEGRIVAIKKSKVVDESQQGEFINEVVLLSQINHRNVVKLLGCCLESVVPLLVFEFIPNGTLFNHIHYPSEEFPITWRMRLQIASDSAGALAYLHSSSSIAIFHRDIKSSNILLDDKYRAKLSDFGTSRYVATDQTHVTTRVMGTFGYLDPEYFQSSKFTEKSDVYSFGVVLVELLTGQKAIRAMTEEDRSLVSWFLSHMENSHLLDIVDSQVLKEGSKEETFTIADLARRCLNLDGRRRPTMKEVLLVLETLEAVISCPITLN